MTRALAISLIIVLVSCVEKAQASTKALQIKPENCLNQSEHCDIEVEFSWSLNEPRSFCIFQLGLNLPEFCIVNSRSGSRIIQLDVSETVEFVLVDSTTDVHVDTSLFRVFTSTVQKRKRKRHAWSIL
ncbi:DUF3019 domain-containing protein [Thalassotalea sp. HSM 43]|uniref:DUF3019 domain-containing protein n=1 Tax=Thalassotalea sp. HSM 43 TaxID=2552945 RepID=UPI001080BED1|nr:DUF3019 domain-containing protein [Thalassotalea sp. HSM 43]QBY02928.1 DUF3019 domain-containing protein [Thalassotalea sp. HSM 43]